MKNLIFHFILFCFAMASSLNLRSQSAEKHFSAMLQTEVNYLLYLPQTYNADKLAKFPLILFLHGSGESGSDLNMINKNGITKLIAEGKDFPFIIVSP